MFNAASANPGFDADGTKLPAPPIHENNYGFSFGGPVVLPRLCDGRKKTFFHVSADWFRLNQKDTRTMTVPTVAEVNGDFSALLSLASPQPIFVPQGFVPPTGCTAPLPGQQWPGNVIPKSCFSASSASLLPLITAPSLPGAVEQCQLRFTLTTTNITKDCRSSIRRPFPIPASRLGTLLATSRNCAAPSVPMKTLPWQNASMPESG